MWWRRLRACEVGEHAGGGAGVAPLEEGGTAGGSTACLHIITIRMVIILYTSPIAIFAKLAPAPAFIYNAAITTTISTRGNRRYTRSVITSLAA